MFSICLAWFLTLFMSAAQAQSADFQTIELKQATYKTEDNPNWRPVNLPDKWFKKGISQNEDHRQYRLNFYLDPQVQPSEINWAMRSERLPSSHEIKLNGQTIELRRRGQANQAMSMAAPSYIEFPAILLRNGPNEISVDINCSLRCSMGAVELGSADTLLARHHQLEALTIIAPQLLNASMLSLAIFMIWIWRMRPQEESVGVFGILWVLEAVRNYSYFESITPLPWGFIQSAFFFFNIELTLMLILFALSMSPRRRPRLRRFLWTLTLLAPVVATLGGMTGQLHALQVSIYPVLLVSNVYGFFLLWKSMSRFATATFVALWVAIGMSILASLHDFLNLIGRFSLIDGFLHPWVSPLMFASFAIFLLGRIGRSLGEAEDLNQHLEHRVEVRTAELNAANLAKTRFIASASHDLRQPLHAMGLMVGLLNQRVHDPDVRSILSRIDTSVESMETMFNGILDVSRLDAGVERPNVQAVAVSSLFAGVERAFAAVATRKGIELRIRSCPDWVASDAHLLQRILNNLISNALRYTERGAVLLCARRRGSSIRLEVWDTGCGIPEDQLEDVFLEFVQLDNPERDREKGLGLGLAIVRRTAQLLNHTIEVKSRINHGTVFRLTVAAVDMPVHSIVQNHDDHCDVSGLFVLVVDDEQDIRFAMQGLLGDWGCLVAVAKNGDEALSLLNERLRPPDAILLDYRMPNETGVELAQRLAQALGEDKPTLIVTGDITPGPLLDISNNGLQALHKPVNPQQLRSWLGEIKKNIS